CEYVCDSMSQDKAWSHKTGPEKLVSVLVFVARFGTVISVLVFLVSSNILELWVATPIAHGIAALLATLPFYWFIPQRKVGFAAYVAVCVGVAACLSVIEYYLIRLWSARI